jgi:hypothetical protein
VAAGVSARRVRALVAAALAASCAAAGAAQPTLKSLPNADRIVNACNELAKAVLDGNIDRGIALTYPRLVELVGRERLAAAMKAASAGSPQFTALGARCEAPAQYASASGLRIALVPAMTRARVPEGTLLVPNHYLAVSSDNGETWTFLFLNPGATPEQLQQFFPDGIGDLHLPAAQKPILLPSASASASAASAP